MISLEDFHDPIIRQNNFLFDYLSYGKNISSNIRNSSDFSKKASFSIEFHN